MAEDDTKDEVSTRWEFPQKLYGMLEDVENENNQSIVSWMPHGRAFKVHDRMEFETKIMPRYFTEKYDSFRVLLGQWGFLRLSARKSRDRGAYFHKSFIRGKRHLCIGVDKHKFMKEMPEFLPVSDEPDLYAIAEKEAEEERKRLGDKAPRVPPGESSKDFAGKGGASKDAGASMLKPTKSIKTQHPSKPKVERKKFSTGGKVVVPKRKERRKFEEFDNPFAYQSRFDPIQTEDDESTVLEKMAEMSPASRRMSKMQFLQNIPLCQYYVPPLQQSPRPYSMPPILRDAIQLDDKSRGFLLFGDSNGLDPSIQNQKSPKKRKLSLSTERDNEYPSKLAKSISTGDAMNRPQTEGYSQFSTAATPRGVTMRESGKWQAQVYYAGQSRYIGVFVSREEACIAYESVREKLRRAKVGAHDSNSTQDDPFNSAKRAVIESARKRHALG